MTPTPEVSERARALRRIADRGPNLGASVIRAIVTELGITQEMVGWQEPCCDVPMPGCCSRHEHAVHMVLATLLAAGGSDD